LRVKAQVSLRYGRRSERLHPDRRRRRIRERWAGVAGPIPRDPPPATYPAELSELEVAVDRALAALPERGREVFRLFRTTRLTRQEVAGLLGIAPQTVANLMTPAPWTTCGPLWDPHRPTTIPR